MKTLESAQHIEISRVLSAAPAAIFTRLTSPADLQIWFAQHVEVEPRVGGPFRFWGRHTPCMPSSGLATQRITTIEPDRLLAFTWRWGGNDTLVRLELTPEVPSPPAHPSDSPRTRVSIHHTLLEGTIAGYSREESPLFAEDFWCVSLGNLREYLAAGRPALLPDYSTPGPEARVSIEINAPRERVWKALTDPAQMDKWLSKAAACDPRPGGAYSYGWEFEDFDCGPRTIIEIDPPRRLLHDWIHSAEPAARTEWTLDALSPTTTRVTVRQIGVHGERNHTGYTGGWAKFALALRDYAQASPG